MTAVPTVIRLVELIAATAIPNAVRSSLRAQTDSKPAASARAAVAPAAARGPESARPSFTRPSATRRCGDRSPRPVTRDELDGMLVAERTVERLPGRTSWPIAASSSRTPAGKRGSIRSVVGGSKCRRLDVPARRRHGAPMSSAAVDERAHELGVDLRLGVAAHGAGDDPRRRRRRGRASRAGACGASACRAPGRSRGRGRGEK